MESKIQINDIVKDYGNFSLSKLDFDIAKGYITGFIGPNGSGKTTTIKSILSLIDLDSGSILFDGEIVYYGLKDDLLEKFVIIKGGSEDFKNIDKKLLMGTRSYANGFEAMIRKEELKSVDQNLIVEMANIDKIMKFYKRGVENV